MTNGITSCVSSEELRDLWLNTKAELADAFRKGYESGKMDAETRDYEQAWDAGFNAGWESRGDSNVQIVESELDQAYKAGYEDGRRREYEDFIMFGTPDHCTCW